VLVVDDDADTRAALARTLASEGCRVAEAADGRAALEALEPATPDLILLDLVMPGMDGFEFLDALRAEPRFAGVPVIVVTAADLTADDRRRLEGGVEQILEKTAHDRDALLDEVRERVRAVIRTPATEPDHA